MKVLDLQKPILPDIETPLRVLILEKSEVESQIIIQELSAAGMTVEPTVVTGRGEFLETISCQDFSAVLAAYQLPDWCGLEALQELRKAGRETPFILVTGVLGEDIAEACLKQGVNDCVLKDCLACLPMALRRAMEEKCLRDANSVALRALQESESRNQELIENSIYGVFRVSLDGSIVFANPALLHILASPSLKVLQSSNLATDVFRFPEHYIKLLASCRRDGLVQSVETEFRRKNNGLVAVKLHLRRISVPGAADQMEGIVEDVTEIRALEHQLLQAQKFETIGQLAGGVAHDFNNVVGAILGWAELGYEESKAFPGIAERFARIREQADRAATLTRELLAFARCQDLQPRPVDLNAIIGNLTTFLDKVIGSDIEMHVHPGNLQPIQADPVQIEQVLMNLCLNARDAMPAGGHLSVETQVVNLDDGFCRFYPYVAPGRYVLLSVSDTGIGMTQEIRDRIFEPFFTTKERGTSSGMGLATAYGIVKQHSGFIHVYSELGQGSVFNVYLPILNGAHPALAPKAQRTESSKSLHLGGTEIILLAEDHDSIREMARQWLVNLGYRVLCAADGQQALEICEQETPALAVLDVIMPRMGGAATAAQLRSRFPGLPLLFTSGYYESKDTAVTQLDHSSYLQKPYSPTSLGRAIRKILDPEPSSSTE